MSMRRTIIAASMVIAITGALVWAFMPRPFPVESIEVTRGLFEQAIEDDGKTRVRERYIVSAPIGGRMERVELDPGDRVKRGQTLAVLHPMVPPLLDVRTEAELRERIGAAEAALARAATGVERARATLEKAKADLDRTRILAGRNFVSAAQVERDELTLSVDTRELEALQFERHAAEHQLELARAALARSRTGWQSGRGERLEIRSPVEGIVFRVLQENEAAVSTGASLVELAEPRALEVVVDVLSSDAVQIPPGARVHLHHYGKARELEGRVRRVEPSAFTKISALGVEEQRVNVIIDLVSPAGEWQALGDGYRVDARIVVFSLKDAVTVPVGAIFRDGDGWAVFAVRGNTARKQSIEAPRRSSTSALVVNGLAAGERVILYPAERVRDGTRVRAISVR
jgi:HlyD family secretion protein